MKIILPLPSLRAIRAPSKGYRVDTFLASSHPVIAALKNLIPVHSVVIPGCLLLS